MSKKKALTSLITLIVSFVLLVSLFVWAFDPFYLYHEPFFGLQKVLYDRDYQVAGTIRNFSYNRVFLGSSMVENFNTDYLDEKDNLTSIKAVKSSGRIADHLYYLDMIHKYQNVQEIYLGLDIAGLTAPPETVLYGDDIPRYVHTDTILDDIPYLFNKDVIFKEIPALLGYSLTDSYVGGDAYQWYKNKTFGPEAAMRAYIKPSENLPPQNVDTEKSYVDQNIELLLAEVRAHPEIEYTFFYTPYSLLWWDCGYANGINESHLYAIEASMPALLECENVNLYFFQTNEDIVLNLDNYMDMFHYHPWVNQYMLESMETGAHLVTKENYEQYLIDLHELFQYIIEKGIYKYYEKTE